MNRKVEVMSGDHQNKPDIGAGIARRWLDVEGVDMIIDLPNSAVALAVGDIVREKNKVAIGSGAGTAALTGIRCSPNFVHWTYDTWAFGHGTARGVLAQGGKSWFFVTADYAFGQDLEKQASDEVNSSGGKVLGSVVIRSPPTTSRLSCCKRRPPRRTLSRSPTPAATPSTQSSRPPTSTLAESKRSSRLFLICRLSQLSACRQRKVCRRSMPGIGTSTIRRAPGRSAIRSGILRRLMPNHMQAGVYSAVLHYLKAVEKLGSPADGDSNCRSNEGYAD